MIFTPASTSSSASGWAAARRHREHADDDVLVLDDLARGPRRRGPRWPPTFVADLARVGVEDRHDAEAVVGEDVRGGDRLAEVAGAEQRDVVLAGGPQDLADLRDERVDVVADAALAELAEARQVAADLRRVDVRVVGELLRGDRLLAHLLGLREHLQVAREARRDAERQPRGGRLAIDAVGVRALDSPILIVRRLYRSQPQRQVRCVDEEVVQLLAVERDHRDALEVARVQLVVGLDVDVVEREVLLTAQSPQHVARLVAEVAARAPVDGHERRHSAALPGRVGVERRGRRRSRAPRSLEARGAGDHRRVVGAELRRRDVRVAAAERAEPLAQRAVAATPPPIASRSRPVCSSAALDALRERLDDRVAGRRRRGRPGAARLLLAEVAQRVEQRGLQPGEARSRARRRRRARGKSKAAGSPSCGEPLEVRAAGERQAEQARALVERLAGGVVERRAEDLEARGGPRRARGTCGRRWRSGTGTAARTGPGARKFAATWPWRWSTGDERQRRARRRAPWRSRRRRAARRRGPGPAVTATASTSSSVDAGLRAARRRRRRRPARGGGARRSPARRRRSGRGRPARR